jgi:hypothetical protein
MLYCIQFLYLNLLKKQLIIRYSLEGKTHLNLISLKKNTLIIKRCAVELDIKKCLKSRYVNTGGDVFSSPSQRQSELLLSLAITWRPSSVVSSVVCRPLTFHIIPSPLKTLCQMNCSLVGNIYERSSIKIAHFVPIR